MPGVLNLKYVANLTTEVAENIKDSTLCHRLSCPTNSYYVFIHQFLFLSKLSAICLFSQQKVLISG